jgi:transposase-like protein
MKHETLEAQMDLAMQAVQRAGKHRAQIHLEQVENITLLTVTIGRKSNTQYFLDDVRAFTYWFNREERAPLVKHYYHEGLTRSRIAAFLGVSPTTIGKDVRALRDNNELDENKRTRRSDIRPTLKLQPTLITRKVVKVEHDLRDFAFSAQPNA